MLNDILTFAARTLVTDGRLSMWMPTANDEVELVVPMHPNLELVSVSVQSFGNCKFSIYIFTVEPWGYSNNLWANLQQGLVDL